MKEPNSFEGDIVAKEWIQSIESVQKSSRELEYYPLLDRWSKNFHSATIVEIGSGQGVCSSHLDLSTNSYIGIEPSKILIERARELYPETNRKFIEGNSSHLPLPDESVDAVFSLGVWFHIQDVDKAHEEAHRILKPGGKLLILTGNPESQSQWESFFENPKVEGNTIEGKVYVPGGSMSHNIVILHSRQKLITSLEDVGFEVNSVEEMGFGSTKRKQGIFIKIEAVRI